MVCPALNSEPEHQANENPLELFSWGPMLTSGTMLSAHVTGKGVLADVDVPMTKDCTVEDLMKTRSWNCPQ